MNALDQIGIRVLESASVKTKSYAIFAQPLRLSKTSLAFPNDETVLEDGSSKMTGAHELPSRGGQAVGRADACHNGKSDKTDPAVFPYPRDLTRAARKPPRCSPVFMSRSRHDAPIRLLLPGAASRAIRVPVGCLPGLFCPATSVTCVPESAAIRSRARMCATLGRRRARVAYGRPGSRSPARAPFRVLHRSIQRHDRRRFIPNGSRTIRRQPPC